MSWRGFRKKSSSSALGWVFLPQSVPCPVSAQVFVQLCVNWGGVNPVENRPKKKKKKKKEGLYLYQTVPLAGVPYCCTKSSPGKGVVTSNNQASWSKAEIILFVCGGVKCQTNHSLIFYPLRLPQIFPNTSILDFSEQQSVKAHGSSGFPLPLLGRE